MQHYLLLLILIILVYFAYQLPFIKQYPTEFTIIAVIATVLLLGVNLENFESKYGNISLPGDIDTLQQNVPIPIPPLNKDNVNDFDNSDTLDYILNNGTSVFQPYSGGVTATSNASDNSFNLGEPEIVSKYETPFTNNFTVDENLARKQQHRASINKKAIDGHIRSTKNLYNKYFRDELEENEETEWWTAEAQEIETDYNAYT